MNDQLEASDLQLGDNLWSRLRSPRHTSSSRLIATWVRVHQHEQTIERALSSVYRQELVDHVDVNIVLHGCTDGSEKIARDFLAEYPEITTIYRADKLGLLDIGQSFRRLLTINKNIQWHCFLPGDDYWLPGKILLHENILRHDRDLDFYFHTTVKNRTWNQNLSPQQRYLDMLQRFENKTQYSITCYNDLQDFIQLVNSQSIGIESMVFNQRLLTLMPDELVMHPQGDLVFDLLCLIYGNRFCFVDSAYSVYEVGKHPTGWNVMLRKNAQFDRKMTLLNLELLTQFESSRCSSDLVKKWCRERRSQMSAEFLWRRPFGELILEDLTLRKLILLKDIPFAYAGVLLRRMQLTDLVFRTISRFRSMFAKFFR